MRRFGICLLAVLLAAGSARADESPPTEKFFSLSSPRHLPDGKTTVPLRGSAHFFPLAQKHRFFSLPRHAGPPAVAALPPHLPAPAAAAAAPAPVVSASATAASDKLSDSRTGMTREEAHQILSLFSSTR